MKKDPIQLQCLTEQMHAIVATITDIASNNDDIDIDNSNQLVIFRTESLTHWLKETCFNIHVGTPTKDLVASILAALRHVGGLSHLCLWQQQETLNTHVESALQVVANMASEAHSEAIRLWGVDKTTPAKSRG